MKTEHNTSSTAPELQRLADYQPPAYAIDHVNLQFTLDPDATVVTNRMQVRQLLDEPLVLDGEGLQLLSLTIDGVDVEPSQVTAHHLTLESLPASFTLEIVTQINPAANKALEGLYVSNGRFCTQCEAAGFRHMTYYLDRPDVMAVFTTTIQAPKAYPILLSNGNLVAKGVDADGHWARWEDPHKKPCYLFALVAGDLAVHRDRFTTHSGREVVLEIYVEPQDKTRTAHAMNSLKASMAWDEKVYGREYDLDVYMIVAVNDFNMGAMENKGLNIFNAKYVLASPDTATDDDYDGIESVIAHEYFHNWTGNRITCRDWFQLSLKEGLTVFRDQEFSADMNSRALQRITDVKRLREFQFTEDAGPTAHPIRPSSYGEVNNLYTATVYEKGAEVIRMQHTLLGADGFRKGMDLYFDRHDGQAVTCEDFTQCMQDANDVDWSQFLHWYSQAGTPVLTVDDEYDAATGRYVLTLQQHTPDTPGQNQKAPLLIPVAVAVYTEDGQQLLAPQVLQLTDSKQTFAFDGLVASEKNPGSNQPPLLTPSLLRGLSAPTKLRYDYTTEQLLVLMQHDDDALCAWDAAQRLQSAAILSGVDSQQVQLTPDLLQALQELLQQTVAGQKDPALVAEMLALPSMSSLSDGFAIIPVDALHVARLAWQQAVGTQLQSQWQAVYDHFHVLDDAGARRLKNMALQFLCVDANPAGLVLAATQQQQAQNMTDEFAALKAQAWQLHAERTQALQRFAERWQANPLVMDKWLMLQATAPTPSVLADVEGLQDHTAFDANNPNRIRALIAAFARMNDVHFHQADGAGYALVADWVIRLDDSNPQVAAALVSAFNRWRRYDDARQVLMQQQLECVQATVQSSNVRDIVARALTA